MASYLTTKDPKDCTGCGACSYVCPIGAISMKEDGCGYVYPRIDESECIHCDKCLRSCHMSSSAVLRHEESGECYGAVDGDATSLYHSASGGVATAISRRVVENGGVVYGCVADREDVHHERISDLKGLLRAQGSKYVQSDLSRVFAPIEADLRAGRTALFVGTPCQCAAVRNLFGRQNELMTVDLICEGTPNHRMYADFLDDLETERGARVTDFRFRDKRGGWSTKNAVVLGEGGEPLDRQPHSYYYYYYYLFSKALTLRESCYTCPYACAERVGDLTVGDLWGAETAGLGYGFKDLEAGVSCVLVNTLRGREALDDVSLMLRKSEFDTIARSNSCLLRPSVCDQVERVRVLAAYSVDGASGMRREYERIFSKRARFKAELAANMPLVIRVALKRVKAMFRGGNR